MVASFETNQKKTRMLETRYDSKINNVFIAFNLNKIGIQSSSNFHLNKAERKKVWTEHTTISNNQPTNNVPLLHIISLILVFHL